ncbi:MAG: hypothetical protein ACR2JS_02410 [Candidatus Nanopelagicales bacterium]
MPTATVLVLGELPEIVDIGGIEVVPSADGAIPLIARVCAEITRLAPTPPLVIVTQGELALLLPGIALAQRTARRSVLAYVLVDPVLPAVSEQWPDARVHVVGRAGFELRAAELRGWDVHDDGDLPGLVVGLAAEG